MVTFIKDYKTDENLRTSFNTLALETFGISFEEWYQNGFWNENYMTYSFSENGCVISNVSANRMTLMVDGVETQAIQIGTVMTHPEYRRRGLAYRLIEKIFEDFDEDVSLFFLAADSEAKPLYSKCGFAEVPTVNCFIEKPKMTKNESMHLRREQISLDELLNWKEKALLKGSRFEVVNDAHILAFYWFHGFENKIYSLGNETLIIADIDEEDKKMVLYDYYQLKAQSLTDLLNNIWNQTDYDLEEIKIEFDLDVNKVPKTCIVNKEVSRDWMVRELKGQIFPKDICYPKLSQA